MLQMSILEKLNLIKEMIGSSIFSILAFVVIVFIGFLFITTNRHNERESKKTYKLLYGTIGIFFLILFFSSLRSIADYFMNQVFIQIYFPSLAAYILGLIVANILMWRSMFYHHDQTLKKINTVFFCLIHYLFALLLNLITMKGLNVFDTTSIYGNRNALAIIEMTSSLFIFWILLLVIYHFVKKFLVGGKELVLEEIPVDSKYYVKKESPILPVESPKKVILEKETKKEKQEEKATSFGLYDAMLTVEDYKLLLDLLKKYQHKEQVNQEELEERKKELPNFYPKIR